jgi:predicted Ser/Thr protein kinase
MDTKPICKECGAPLSADAPEGLCPKCLLKVALGSQAGPLTATAPGPTGFDALPDPAKLAQCFPQLEILELLGQGGMGAVYKAKQPGLDRLVALKILPPQASGDAGFAERFNREARALAKLSHPNIVAVYDFGQTQGLHYLVMEYVDGPNLRQIEQANKLSTREALQIIPQICEALQFAHDEGVVHRDVKPENVLIDKKGRVKIADFGLAKMLGREPRDPRLTGARDVMGTPNYMAPEQVEHPQEVDHRADIYSLGVVFYEMLTGELPLGKFAPPSKKVQVDVRLDEVVLHTLEKEPSRRYQHASEVKSDVETIANSEQTASASGTGPKGRVAALQESSALADSWHQVKGPAIGLILTGIVNWVAIPLVLLVAATVQNDVDRRTLVWVLPLAGLILSAVIFAAGLKLKRLEAYTLCVVGSVLAILVTPGNLIGLPIGIWALVVLTQRDMRAAFAARARGTLRTLPPLPPSGGSQAWKVAAVVVAAGLLTIAILVASLVLAIGLPVWSRAKAAARQQAPAFVVRGIVRDAATGRPISGARVADNIYNARPDRPPQEAWTDANGRYQLKTWYEEHTLAASAPAYETALATLSTTPSGTTSASIDFRLRPATQDGGGGGAGGGEAIPAVPPVVTRTFPESGASGVDPALDQLQVTFSKSMKAESWAWCYDPQTDFAANPGEPRYLADGRTCTLPVKLKPGKVYAIWINTEKFNGFQDFEGRPAVPYLLIFETRK